MKKIHIFKSVFFGSALTPYLLPFTEYWNIKTKLDTQKKSIYHYNPGRLVTKKKAPQV